MMYRSAQGGRTSTMAAPALSPVMPDMAPAAPVTHDVTLVTTRKSALAKVVGVPPEEFGIARGARSIRESNYCFHETIKSVGELEAQGFDRDQLDGLVSANADGIETLSRDTVDESSLARDTLNASARPVRVTEHYIRMDYEDKGKTCIYRVTTAGEGGEILTRDGKEDIERVDVYPFASATAVPVAHRFFGRSIADLVMPLQREKTALKRAALDNLYMHNNARVEVADSHAGPNTLDDLLVHRIGGLVRTRQPGGIQWQIVPDITGSVYPMIQYLDAELETRTGVSKQSQGIDANALQNQSATAVAQVFSASQMRVKLIARNLAEGVRDMFALLHATIRKHGQQAQTARLRNEWVEVDPRNWKTRVDMTINVGLGSGGKAQQFAQVMALANVQKEMLAGGKANLVDDQGLYNTASELTKIMGYKNPEKFFNDPSAKDPETGELMHPPVAPPPDPKIVQIEKQSELDAKADERKAQIESLQAQADIATHKDKTSAEMAQAQMEFELKKELALLEAKLEQARFEREEARKDAEHAHKMELERQSAVHAAMQPAAEPQAKSEGSDRMAEAIAALAMSMSGPREVKISRDR